MKKILLIAFVLLCSSVAFHAQDTAFRALNLERGNPSEMKGLTKLYVNTGGNSATRERIVEEIRKTAVPGLIVVNSREEAEMVMRFGDAEEEVLEGMTTNPVVGTDWTMTTVDRRTLLSGRGFVFIAGKEQKRPRIVMSFQSRNDKAFGERPTAKFAEKFLKAYKEANGLK